MKECADTVKMTDSGMTLLIKTAELRAQTWIDRAEEQAVGPVNRRKKSAVRSNTGYRTVGMPGAQRPTR